MAVVVSWPGGVFPGAPLTTVGGKRRSKTRKIRKSRKGNKKTRRA
jgi:hypothetical protein